MAFCPHCGTRLGAQVSACAACGAEIDAAPTASANRFKGTMMMAPAALKAAGQRQAEPQAEQPPARPQPQRAPAERPVQHGTLLGGLNPPPDPNRPDANRQRQPPFATSRDLGPGSPGKPAAFNATIMGGITADGDSQPPRSPQAIGHQPAAPRAIIGGPPPGHADPNMLGHAHTAMAPALGHVATERMDMAEMANARPPSPRTRHDSAQAGPAGGHASPFAHGGQGYANQGQHPHHSGGPGSGGYQREEPSQRMLVGDPMVGMEPTASGMDESRPRLDVSRQRTTHRNARASGLLWVAVGFIGMLAIAGLGVLAAKMLGLL